MRPFGSKLPLVVFGLGADIDACNFEASLACAFGERTRKAAFVNLDWVAILPRVPFAVKAEVVSAFFDACLLC